MEEARGEIRLDGPAQADGLELEVAGRIGQGRLCRDALLRLHADPGRITLDGEASRRRPNPLSA